MFRPAMTLAALSLCFTITAHAQVAIGPAADSDRDGISDASEASVLGTGDGNRDGVADAHQSQVVSFQLATNTEGGSREGTVSNTDLRSADGAGRLTRVQPIDWSRLGGISLGGTPPVQIEATGDALVLQYELHGAGLAEGSRFYWLSNQSSPLRGATYFIDVLGGAEQAGDNFVLTIEDGAPNDLAKEQGVIRVIGFPR